MEGLLDEFVCVRITEGNRLDLTLFQFDYDLTFAVFFLNADGTVYGRYGSRSQAEDADSDVSLEGLCQSVRAALELHRDYPRNRDELAGKQPRPVSRRLPEDFPALAGKYPERPDYAGDAVRTCVHCHQLRDAERLELRSRGEPFTLEVLHPYPAPRVVGAQMDPRTAATLSSVAPDSAAARAGWQPGDEILTAAGQPVISPADLSWVLHHAPPSGTLPVVLRRGGEEQQTELALDAGWRRQSDISWRVSTWDLRRMALGGMVLEPTDQSPSSGGPSPGLKVGHVGQYGEHAVAKKAGFRTGDLILSMGGHSAPASEGEIIGRLLNRYRPGQQVPVRIERKGEVLQLSLPLQ